jgi:hypothetical protein
VLTAGAQTLTATFTPTDANDYTTASASVTLTVNKATPVIVWATPAPITYGTPLSATQLNATSTVAGSFAYSPLSGTVPAAGAQTLTATFTPTDAADYTTASASVTLTVNKATPVIVWATPAPIAYGTPLSAAQLYASSTVAGSFAYSPLAGTVLTAGAQTLTATFTPTDATDYTTATASVTLTVNKATPAITWATPAAITYGTPLSATQLNATSTVAGSFTYSPVAGTVLTAGAQTLTATFTPTDANDYTTASASVTLTVNKATPVIVWATPAPIAYGTPLSATQLNATSTVAGSFAYSPLSGTVLTAGAQTLTATFTPTDATDYTTASASVTLTVNKATPVIVWATPAAITYGTPLSATQLNATSTVAGSFTYSPVAGTVLTAGAQTLTATFTPTDATDYTTATASVTLTVNKATPAIVWATPAAITYGTPLSATQLNATSTVAGSFTYSPQGIISYSPSLGTVLSIGQHTLTATFTPTDTTDYTTATASVTLIVNNSTPAITWTTPAAITYGTPLSATQLDATSPIQGSFSYSPSAGTVLGVGPHTLTATFTPTNTTDYTTNTATVTLTVIPATPSVTLTASVNPVFTSNPLTFTATLTVPATAPTGTVTFYDGTTPLGSGVVTASVATLTLSAPATGIHSITAVYSGDTNYTTANSLILSEIIQDFTIALPTGAAGTVTVPFGGQADYPLVVTSLGGATLPAAVSLTLTGLPPGMTAAFSTDVVASGSSTANVTLQVFMPGSSALQPPPGPFGGRSLPLALGLILLPFAGRLRKTAHRFRKLAVLALAGAALAVGGCQITFTPKTYPLNVTATSGTLSHTTTVNIIVQ